MAPEFPIEIRDKILQPFFTTKKGTEGTGLGLSITHDIIKAHGGELKVETTVGQSGSNREAGTVFNIHLPIQSEQKWKVKKDSYWTTPFRHSWKWALGEANYASWSIWSQRML